jgi:hypothetical protein
MGAEDTQVLSADEISEAIKEEAIEEENDEQGEEE